MRKDEFAIVDKIRKDDMEYIINRFNKMVAEARIMTDEILLGISLCYGIVKEYQDKIGRDSNDNKRSN